MKLLRSLRHVPAFAGGTVATIGNFDGVHLGHQALLAQLKIEASRRQLPLVVLLFEPQPSEFFQKEKASARLSTLREKLAILKACQVDYVYCLRFDNHLANMSAEQFAQVYFFSLLKIRYLLIGNDFRFGKARWGDGNLLKGMALQHDCLVETFPDFALTNSRVSSTKIRQALSDGQLSHAATLLGRLYSMCGRVIRGANRGKEWGFPTANIAMRRLSLPLMGVFCVQVKLLNGTLLNGVANLGKRPTIDGSKFVLEIHLLNFKNNIYGQLLHVSFLAKLRDEIKFSSSKELIAQIHQDVAAAATYFISDRSDLTQYLARA